MQIKIEIDLKPEELRQFLGIPDVLGIQEDLFRYARDKFSDQMEGIDPKSFVKENMEAIRGTKEIVGREIYLPKEGVSPREALEKAVYKVSAILRGRKA